MFYGKPVPLAVMKTQENRESGGWGFARSLRGGGEDENDEENMMGSQATDLLTKPLCHTVYRSVRRCGEIYGGEPSFGHITPRK
jgi:hypothetical protein